MKKKKKKKKTLNAYPQPPSLPISNSHSKHPFDFILASFRGVRIFVRVSVGAVRCLLRICSELGAFQTPVMGCASPSQSFSSCRLPDFSPTGLHDPYLDKRVWRDGNPQLPNKSCSKPRTSEPQAAHVLLKAPHSAHSEPRSSISTDLPRSQISAEETLIPIAKMMSRGPKPSSASTCASGGCCCTSCKGGPKPKSSV